ncbi:HesA/MoeB/ThiF family protein [uncultured Kriegella sp.]|uniref:HesA/MoeB/ThiF family protein n=1 Tax=uncultured Kriegella sp. TaxID=1798910 RepID=UPI0030DA5485|tara:strand:- start:277204 stop:278277 length:1074 start_codon:yes stop_codon:yes gene_type:complete
MNHERYIRQTVLDGFGDEAQRKLSLAKVLVVGAGGLGVPVLTYLNAMGIGTLGIVDNDVVALTNLQRQVLYSEKDIGFHKVTVAIEKLRQQNSETTLKGHTTYLSRENALDILADYDMVVDASDNFPTRYLINDACVILDKPFVYGALHSFEGQVSVFNYKGGPSYRCLFPKMPQANEVPDCNENGVLGIIPGIIGNFQALEVIKMITEVGAVLSGELLLFDGLSQNSRKIKFPVVPENLDIKALNPSYDFECSVVESTISSEAFLNLLHTDDIQVIDVRTSKEFNRVHLEESCNIPLSVIDESFEKIAFDKPIYVICQSGIRSKKAISKLREIRPNATLINVKGGMNNLNVQTVGN